MALDSSLVAELIVTARPIRWLRAIPKKHAATPDGMGYGQSRFSAPNEEFKVMYFARDLTTALAETIVRDRFEGVSAERRTLFLSEVINWALSEISLGSSVNLLDLRAPNPLRLGINTDATGCRSHNAGQRLSREVHDQFEHVDGFVYQSRLTGGPCIVLFERATPTVTASKAIDLINIVGLADRLASLSINLLDDI